MFSNSQIKLNNRTSQQSDTKATFNRFLWGNQSFKSYLHKHFFTIIIPKSADMYTFKKLNNKKTILNLSVII